MVLSGVFLYPPLESLTLSPRPPVAATPAPPPPAPVPSPVDVAPVESAEIPVETIGKSVAPPKPIRQPAPSIPPGIRSRITGTIPIAVTVRIGANGAVTRVEAPHKGGGLTSYLAQRAVEAVRQWKFRPAMLDRDPVAAETVIRFRFRRSGAEWN